MGCEKRAKKERGKDSLASEHDGGGGEKFVERMMNLKRL